MKTRLLLVMLCCLVPVGSTAFAGSGYDTCRQEERRLRSDETELCGTMGYLFNPSACFNARKALAPYDKGKCRELAVREGVTEQGGGPVKGMPAPPAPPRTTDTTGTPETTGRPDPDRLVPAGAAPSSTELEQLRREMDDLKAELRRQQQEIERLRRGK